MIVLVSLISSVLCHYVSPSVFVVFLLFVFLFVGCCVGLVLRLLCGLLLLVFVFLLLLSQFYTLFHVPNCDSPPDWHNFGGMLSVLKTISLPVATFLSHAKTYLGFTIS